MLYSHELLWMDAWIYTSGTQLVFFVGVLKAIFDRSSYNLIWCNNAWICVCVPAFHGSVKMGERVSFDVIDRTAFAATPPNSGIWVIWVSCPVWYYLLDWIWELHCSHSRHSCVVCLWFVNNQILDVLFPSQSFWCPHHDWSVLRFPGHPIGAHVKARYQDIQHPSTNLDKTSIFEERCEWRSQSKRDSSLDMIVQITICHVHQLCIYSGLRFFPDVIKGSTLATIIC